MEYDDFENLVLTVAKNTRGLRTKWSRATTRKRKTDNKAVRVTASYLRVAATKDWRNAKKNDPSKACSNEKWTKLLVAKRELNRTLAVKSQADLQKWAELINSPWGKQEICLESLEEHEPEKVSCPR